MRSAEHATEGGHPAEGVVLLEHAVALHAAIELRPHAQRIRQPAFVPAGHPTGGHAVVEQLAGASQQAVDGVGAGALLDGAVGQLAEVPGRGGGLEAVAQAKPGVSDAHLGDDVEVAPAGEHQVKLGEGLDAAADATPGAAHTLGDGTDLAVLRCQQRDDAVGLAQVEVGQHDGAGLVAAWSWHRREPIRGGCPALGACLTLGACPVLLPGSRRMAVIDDVLTTSIMFAC